MYEMFVNLLSLHASIPEFSEKKKDSEKRKKDIQGVFENVLLNLSNVVFVFMNKKTKFNLSDIVCSKKPCMKMCP